MNNEKIIHLINTFLLTPSERIYTSAHVLICTYPFYGGVWYMVGVNKNTEISILDQYRFRIGIELALESTDTNGPVLGTIISKNWVSGTSRIGFFFRYFVWYCTDQFIYVRYSIQTKRFPEKPVSTDPIRSDPIPFSPHYGEFMSF